MSKDPKNWLEDANLAYDDSTTFMDAELRNQWETNIRLYQNRHPSGSKYNSELYQKRSKLFRPKTRTAGVKFEAAVAGAFFSTDSLVDITAENPGDPGQRASAILNKNLLQYRLTKTLPWFKLVLGAAHEAWKMGVVISRQSWVFKRDADGTVIQDEPRVELIPPENFRIDRSADWVDPVNSSPYLIVDTLMYVHEIRERIDQNELERGQVAWKSLTEAEILAARDGRSDSIRTARSGGGTDEKTASKPLSDHDQVPVREVIMRRDGTDYIFYTLAAEALLSDPVPLRDIQKHGRGYVMGAVLIEPFTVYKPGLPEMGQPIQEEMNSVANDRIDNVHLVLNKRYFAKRGRNVDFRSLLRNISGSVTMMDDPLTDVQVVNTPDITQSSYVEQDKLNLDYDELVGNLSQGTMAAGQGSGATMGGTGMMQSGAGQMTEYQIRNFCESWVEPVLRQLVTLEQKYETDETLLAVAGNEEEIKQYREESEKDLDSLLDTRLSVAVNAGIASTNPHIRVERFMYAIGALSKIMESPGMRNLGIDPKEVAAEVFGQLGYKDGRRFFAALHGQEDPRVQQLQEELQQATQALESKQAEAQAKHQAASERLELDVQKHALEIEKAKIAMEKEQAELQEVQARAAKLAAETDRIESGLDDQLRLREVMIREAELTHARDTADRKDKTTRDGILADWKKSREELATKMKITLANRGKPSNNIADLANKTPPVEDKS